VEKLQLGNEDSDVKGVLEATWLSFRKDLFYHVKNPRTVIMRVLKIGTRNSFHSSFSENASQ
jgi:hypothetical protein